MKFLIVLAIALSLSHDLDTERRLSQLYEGHRWFELRKSVENANAPLFYKGAVASAFNRISEAEADLRATTGSNDPRGRQYQVHQLLRYLFLRQGRYRSVLAELDRLLQLDAANPDPRNDRPAFAALGQYGDQEVEKLRYFRARGPAGKLVLPLHVNGVAGTYSLDTGANLSIISMSEAARLHLAVQDVSGKLYDSTGGESGFRISVAKEVQIGDSRFRNVAFLVVNDDQEPFVDLPPGRRGIIGLPVLIALQRIRWNRNGLVEVGFPRPNHEAGPSNLCFDEASLIANVRIKNQTFSVLVDTGAEKTAFWPMLASRLPEIIETGKKRIARGTGVAQSKQYEAVTVPTLPMRVGGLSFGLPDAQILVNQSGGKTQWYAANLGMDILNHARVITMDFEAMTLKLDK